jgi:hypothetical protein
MKHRLSLWTGRRGARGSTTRVRLEASGVAAIAVVGIALVLAATVALCALLREPPRDAPSSTNSEITKLNETRSSTSEPLTM